MGTTFALFELFSSPSEVTAAACTFSFSAWDACTLSSAGRALFCPSFCDSGGRTIATALAARSVAMPELSPLALRAVEAFLLPPSRFFSVSAAGVVLGAAFCAALSFFVVSSVILGFSEGLFSRLGIRLDSGSNFTTSISPSLETCLSGTFLSGSSLPSVPDPSDSESGFPSSLAKYLCSVLFETPYFTAAFLTLSFVPCSLPSFIAAMAWFIDSRFCARSDT
eukprot:CAMPEP_0198733906 /NCGR_PEP_ID=MMETSP1475-20131203/49081_1 /TAXON_ID= ORGANISM="Unidentified sp., Strain CCMP1999" /NCGR_SAMPLE_ID=MMETSP1475 /ASSEMBLY_ACC=CAM_ASM_001111 /LENGTH=222 /DNA_ID=CAMNT_0044497279 /DNA_START=612 /DNA_END=1276 /DNA_ORIENTATION=-